MTWLPMVERELRHAARRHRTWWLRWVAAVAGLLVCGWAGLYSAQQFRPDLLGKTLFTSLSVLAFAYCLLVGPFLTADCISEEKREGTLGLLFLTDLRSVDVVLGKWVAASLAGMYGLLAILPALGLPLLLGGVTPGEYGRTALAIVNAMYFSLAAGLLASSLSREQGRATLGAVATVLGVAGLLPGLVVVVASRFFTQSVPVLPGLTLISPAYAGFLATDGVYGGARREYWLSVGLVHGLAWAFLVAAVLIVPRVWRDVSADRPVRHRWLWRFGYTAGWRRAFRRRLEQNPVYALEARLRWPHLVFWVLVALVTINVSWLTLGYRSGGVAAQFHGYFATALVFTNRVWVSVMACWFFLESRRTGALELLLTTPLPERTLRRGHWRAVRHLFFWPVAAIALLHVWYVLSGWFLKTSPLPMYRGELAFLLINAGASLLNFLTDIVALSFVGAWLSLSLARSTLAIFLTFALVILLPWAVGTFLPGLVGQVLGLLPAGLGNGFQRSIGRGWLSNPYLMNLLSRSGGCVAKNVFFTLWAAIQLRRHLRAAAAGTWRLGAGGWRGFRRRAPLAAANPVAGTLGA